MSNKFLDPIGIESPPLISTLVSQLGDEIGILSLRVSELSLRLNSALSELTIEKNANQNLRLAIEAKDETIKSMREDLVELQKKLGKKVKSEDK